MANSASARKRVRQAEVRRRRNVSLRSKMRTYIKKVRACIESKDLTEGQDAFKKAVPVVDGMVSKGILHKNTAARYKSRLNKQLKQLAGVK